MLNGAPCHNDTVRHQDENFSVAVLEARPVVQVATRSPFTETQHIVNFQIQVPVLASLDVLNSGASGQHVVEVDACVHICACLHAK